MDDLGCDHITIVEDVCMDCGLCFDDNMIDDSINITNEDGHRMTYADWVLAEDDSS